MTDQSGLRRGHRGPGTPGGRGGAGTGQVEEPGRVGERLAPHGGLDAVELAPLVVEVSGEEQPDPDAEAEDAAQPAGGDIGIEIGVIDTSRRSTARHILQLDAEIACALPHRG